MVFGVIGNGVVGSRLAKAYAIAEQDVYVYDVVLDKSPNLFEDLVEMCNCIFVCVPTPTVGYKQELSALTDVLKSLQSKGYSGFVIIKSTVLPGTCRVMKRYFPELEILHSPEFINEYSDTSDLTKAPQIIVGHDGNKVSEDVLKNIFSPFFCDIKQMEYEESELTKYACNVFYAVKNAFFNHLRLVSENMGSDYEKIRQGAISNAWIHPMHTISPGRDGRRGYGGMCLPKDIEAYIGFTNGLNFPNVMLHAVNDFNSFIREIAPEQPKTDWEEWFYGKRGENS